eukprot:15878726-Heterocapsa_arctica.AAC.1
MDTSQGRGSREARENIADKELIREAIAAGEESILFTKGVIPHPADVAPPPTADLDVFIERLDGRPEGCTAMEGDLYVDGSCSKGLVPELSRASWSVAMVDKEGKLQARVSGPVWNTLPQTPQAAEFVSLAVAAELAQGISIVYDDCSNVWPGNDLIRDVIKVKAHQDIENILDQEEKVKAIGNDFADFGAKAAQACHGIMEEGLKGDLTTLVKQATTICRTIAATA